MLRIKLVRSTLAHQWRTRRVVESLGLRKINQVVEHDDTPSIRGMVHRVKELLEVEVVEGTPAKKAVKAQTRTAESKEEGAAGEGVVATEAEAPKKARKSTKKTEESN